MRGFLRKIIFATAAMLSLSCLADGLGMAPVNPAFLKWKARKERREAAKAAETNRVAGAQLMSVTPKLQAGEDEEEIGYGYMPSLVDRSYLANLNTGAKKSISQEGYAAVYDLRSLNRLTPVKNQGSYGTCWAHATMASLESWLRTSENQIFDFSENNLANLHGGDWGFDDGGNAGRASAYLLRWAGPVLESQDPYPNWGGSTSLSPARHVQRIRWIPPRASGSGASLDNDDVKDAIMKYGAVYVNYYHSSSYYNSTYKSYYHPSAERSNHAVAVVGWDDTFSKSRFRTTPPGDGAFIVRNSWGSSWGDGGYFYVSYYDSVFARKVLTAFCSAEETSKYTKVYQYDPLGEVGDYRASNSTTAYGAAIFTASSSDSIGAVGFYALVPNTAYTITVRKSVTAGSPGSGTQAVTQSGTVDDAGFVTIPLTSAVSVSSGTKFSVILKLTTPGYGYPLAVEYLYPGYTSAATASSGQTFISSDGSSWKDFTQVDSSASFCVKAYAVAGTVAKTLSGIACYSSDNSTKVAAGKTKTFTCKATYSDGSEKTVTPSWSITSGSSYGSISSSGVFTAANVSSEQSVGVRASYTEGGVTKTASFTVTITVAAPTTPTGLTATAGSESSCVRLSWTASTGATGYAVYRANGSGKASSAASYLGEASKATYADTDATPGVDYTYFVKAKNGSGASGFSTGASGWRALAAPESVSASDGTSTTQVKITWGAVSGAGAYRVYRAEYYNENAATALGGWQTALEYADTTATPGKLYYYFVKAAVDTAGTRASDWSVGDSGLIQKPVTPESLTIVGPASVASGSTVSYTAQVVYSNGSTASVTPTWTLNSSSSTTATYSYTAPVVSTSQTVSLRAACTVEGKNLSATKTITVTPSVPGTPSAPSVTAQTTSGISLSWNAVSVAASYIVYRGTTTTADAATKVGTSTGTTYTDTSVSPGVTVYYFIAAVNTAGTGPRSSASSAAMRALAAPTGVTASNGAYTDKVRISWSAVSGATHYRVSRATSLNGTQTDLGSWQTGTNYDDTSATAGTTYYYFVRAATSSGGANAGAKSAGVAGLRKVAATLASLAIDGPARVDAGATAVYAAKATYSDSTSKTVNPSWSIASGSGATISSSGTLTAANVAADATVTIQASYTEGGGTKTATCTVTIIAPIPKTVTVSNVKASSRWPWQPLIDIDFTLAVSPVGTTADISVEATDNDRLTTFLAQTLTGDTQNLAAGSHRVTWNFGADKPEYSTTALDVNVKARVHEDPPSPGLGGVQLWENGPYWAECNVGANQPEEYGYYFWWGDTEGYKRNANNDGWISVGDGASFFFSYCPTDNKDAATLQSEGYIDSTGNLVAAHDAATTHLGTPWRMPTDAEWSALISNCDIELTKRNGVYGRLVTGRGSFSTKSIFLPFAGLGYGSCLASTGSIGYYWSSTPHSDDSINAWHLYFGSGDFYRSYDSRYLGRSVRALRGFANVCTVTFDANGGSCATATKSYDENSTLGTLPTATRTGYTFEGWFTSSSGGMQVTSSTVVTGAVTYYAHWTASSPELGGVQLWENGPYWAECNVGASQPEEYGYYFWWGDTMGYTRDGGTWTSDYYYSGVTWVSSFGTRMSSSPFSSSTCPTYGKGISQLQSQGYIDSTGNLVAAYDAATAHLGAPWRMPTDAEWSALISNCDTEWTTRNGVYGRLVTGRGSFSTKSIFLPAAGYGNGSGLYYPGSRGYYWSSTPYSDYSYYAWCLYFSSGNVGRFSSYGRYYGQSVRPVRGFAQ